MRIDIYIYATGAQRGNNYITLRTNMHVKT